MANQNTTAKLAMAVNLAGQPQVTKGIEEINKTIDGTAKQAEKTKKSLGEMNGEFARMGSQASSVRDVFGGTFSALKEGDGILGKTSAAMTVMSSGFNTLTSGVRGFGGMISSIAGTLGPYGMLIGGVTSAASALYDLWSNPTPPAIATEGIRDQTKAAQELRSVLSSLGETATLAEARQKMMTDAAKTAFSETYAQLGAEKKLAEQDLAVARAHLTEYQARIRAWKGAYNADFKQLSADKIATEKEITQLQAKLESLDKRIAPLTGEQEALKQQAEAEKVAAEAQKYAEDMRKRAESDAVKRQQAGKAAAAKAAAERVAQAKRETALLSSIYAEGEQLAWDMQAHTRAEQVQRAAETRRGQIQQAIADEERLQAALVELDRQTALKLATAHAQDISAESAIMAQREAEQRASLGRMLAAVADSVAKEAAAKKKADDAVKAKRLADQQAVIAGYSALTEAATAWGAQSGIVQAMQMAASAIQAGCDSANYASDALGAYAAGNFIQAAGYTAASVAKAAAAAGYTKGLAQMGASGYDTGSASSAVGGAVSSGSTTSSASPATPSSTTLTGRQAQQEEREIKITIGFDRGRLADSSIADALVRGLNASAERRGAAKLSRRVLG